MAITSTKIDGQTLGFSLTAPDNNVNILSLDISTGAITSPYLTATQIQNLKPAVAALFALVPSAQRAAGALSMLQRLITVAPSAAATVTLSAPNVGSVYTLRATVSGVPSQIIAHLPFSADGRLAWATGTGGSSITTPVSLADGGTSTDLSGSSASRGAFFYNGAAGSAGLTPLPVIENPIATNPAVPSVAKNATVQVNGAVKNGNAYYDTASTVFVRGQVLPAGGAVALADLVLTLVTGGFIQPLPDFATTGSFVAGTTGPGPNSGKIEFTVGTTAVNPAGVAGDVFVLLGGGPGSEVTAGGRVQLTFT